MDLQRYKCLKLTMVDQILTISMNRPEQLNAVNETLHYELSTVFDEVSRSGDVRVAVLTGEGRAFSAGGDYTYLQSVIEDPKYFERIFHENRGIIYGILDCTKPIIAKVNGHSAGIGTTMALLCDIIFAADHAKIADPHVKIGVVAGDGGAAIWPQLVGYARAKEFLLTGDPIDAPRAAEMGLINYAVPTAELDDRVDAFARKLAAGSAPAIRGTKLAINAVLKQVTASALEIGMMAEKSTFQGNDFKTAIRAMIAKEEVRFSDP